MERSAAWARGIGRWRAAAAARRRDRGAGHRGENGRADEPRDGKLHPLAPAIGPFAAGAAALLVLILLLLLVSSLPLSPGGLVRFGGLNWHGASPTCSVLVLGDAWSGLTAGLGGV